MAPAVLPEIDTRYSQPDKTHLWNKFIPHTITSQDTTSIGKEFQISTIDSMDADSTRGYYCDLPLTEPEVSTEMDPSTDLRETIFQHLPGIWKSLEAQLDAIGKVLPEVLPDTCTISNSVMDKSTRENFVPRILSAFDQVILEDGISHPAEDLIQKALSEQHEQATHWLQSTVSQGENPCLIASILKCVGRIKEDDCPDWAYSLAGRALEHSDVEVRDAAAQLLEMCGTSRAADLLKKHDESVSWLKDYIHRVVKEIDRD